MIYQNNYKDKPAFYVDDDFGRNFALTHTNVVVSEKDVNGTGTKWSKEKRRV
jgi:hypothetical protein